AYLEKSHSDRLHVLVTDVIHRSLDTELDEIGMTEDVLALAVETREFLFRAVYKSELNSKEFAKVEKILVEVWDHVRAAPERWIKVRAGETVEAQVTDFVAGMTDRFALGFYEDAFMPRPWVGA